MKHTRPTHKGETKKLVVIRGKGTPWEKRIVTDIDLHRNEKHQLWMSIPTGLYWEE